MISRLEADQFTKGILSCDDQILCVLISDRNGSAIAIDWRKGKVPWDNSGVASMKISKDIQTRLGSWSEIILSLAGQTSPFVGDFESASFVHKNFQLVLLNPPHRDVNIGLMLPRSAKTEYVISKVNVLFGVPPSLAEEAPLNRHQ